MILLATFIIKVSLFLLVNTFLEVFHIIYSFNYTKIGHDDFKFLSLGSSGTHIDLMWSIFCSIE